MQLELNVDSLDHMLLEKQCKSNLHMTLSFNPFLS